MLLSSSSRQMVFPSYLLFDVMRRSCLDCDFFLSLKRKREEILHDSLLINAKKNERRKLLLNDLSSFMSGLLDYHFGLFRPQNADIQYAEVLFF